VTDNITIGITTYDPDDNSPDAIAYRYRYYLIAQELTNVTSSSNEVMGRCVTVFSETYTPIENYEITYIKATCTLDTGTVHDCNIIPNGDGSYEVSFGGTDGIIRVVAVAEPIGSHQSTSGSATSTTTEPITETSSTEPVTTQQGAKDELISLLQYYSWYFDYTPEYWYNIYTKESYDAYVNAKQKAEKLLADENTTETEFQNMVEEFQSARHNLVEIKNTSSTTQTETLTTIPITEFSSETETFPTTETTVPTSIVTNPPVKNTTVKLTKNSAYLYVKGTTNINPIVKNGVGATTYKSNNTSVASVDSKGRVTALKAGTAKIAVTNNNISQIFTVTVKNPSLNKKSVNLYVQQSTNIKIIGKIGNATFSSNNKKVATVDKYGKVTAKAKGNATISVKTNGVTLKCNVYVKNPKINSTKKTLKVKQSFNLKITGGVGKASFVSGNKKVATVNNNGKITAKKKGTATITVTTNGIKLKCKVTVK
ncbi:MAG: Ig domain-containing protein, partial [Ruminococcus sp.]